MSDENTKIKSGDVVRLKSGGPPMTVGSLYGSDTSHAVCQWFEGPDLRQGEFVHHTLEHCDPCHVGGF